MLSLFTRRVALSAYRPTATYARILPSPASSLRAGTITGLHIHTAQIPTNPQRNASTKATAVKETKATTTKKAKPSTKTTAAVKKTKSPTKSTTTGRANPRRNLTPEQKAAQKQKLQDKKEKATALRAKLKAQAEKQREAAAQKRKRLALAEKKKKLVEAKRAKEEKEKERKRIREAKKPKIIKPPPRRMSPFSMFLLETKKPLTEVAADWHNLSEEAKQDYAARAKILVEERKEEFNAFLKTVTPLDIMRYNRHQKSRGGTGIRVKLHARPLSSFMRFIQVFRKRPDQAGKSQVEISKSAGEAWRSLTQEEKDQYKSTESATPQSIPEPSGSSSHVSSFVPP